MHWTAVNLPLPNKYLIVHLVVCQVYTYSCDQTKTFFIVVTSKYSDVTKSIVLQYSCCRCIYLLFHCRSVRHQTGHHHLVPGRWQSQGGSAHLMYGSPKPACERCSLSPQACRVPQHGHHFNIHTVAKNALPFSLTLGQGFCYGNKVGRHVVFIKHPKTVKDF